MHYRQSGLIFRENNQSLNGTELPANARACIL